MNSFNVSGALLILLPVSFNIFFFLLGRTFEYPEILRKPTDYILMTFHERRRQIVPLWYAFMFTALVFIFVGMLVPQALVSGDSLLVTMATTLALLAGLTQVLGLIRWPFVVPHLAKRYVDPSTSEASRDALSAVFEALHRYAWVAIGEHLGYLFTALWTLLVGILLVGSPIFPAWLGWIAFIPALGILAGLLEEAGFAAAGAINAVSYILWSLWLIVVGVFFLLI